MKRLVLILSVLFSWVLAVPCFAGIRDYPPIAVLNFDNKSAVPSNLTLKDVSIVSDFMIDELVNCDRFNVMERQQLQALVGEHYLNMTGMVDPATAAEIGKLTGVQYLVYGSVTNLSVKEGTIGYGNDVYGSLSNNQHIVDANISVRIIEVATGRIVLSARGQGSSTSTDSKIYYDGRKETTYQYEDEDGNIVGYETESSGMTHTFTIGSTEVSQVQVQNALAKAVENAVYDKKFGLLARLDGKGKKRR
ncbi:CsgG/HfaB family protein [uncultured Phascolarctobacterium sp.]|uniref:CsgG/HfaB family protein n=1 Tax=uncultured Phascolarctobacterium sp. TaxID=512296 RepID=UPI0025CEF649|nr:CsgG/HfaB family protein [uncultured Phascolarctobacterium sp.]